MTPFFSKISNVRTHRNRVNLNDPARNVASYCLIAEIM
jgi:hypothetical protein